MIESTEACACLPLKHVERKHMGKCFLKSGPQTEITFFVEFISSFISVLFNHKSFMF